VSFGQIIAEDERAQFGQARRQFEAALARRGIASGTLLFEFDQILWLEWNIFALQQFFRIIPDGFAVADDKDFSRVLVSKILGGQHRFCQGQLGRPWNARIPDLSNHGDTWAAGFDLFHIPHCLLFTGDERSAGLGVSFGFADAAGQGDGDERQTDRKEKTRNKWAE
jgi:hypothetical protein